MLSPPTDQTYLYSDRKRDADHPLLIEHTDHRCHLDICITMITIIFSLFIVIRFVLIDQDRKTKTSQSFFTINSNRVQSKIRIASK